MRRSVRRMLVSLCALILVAGMMPAEAYGAVTVTWSGSWGSNGLGNGQFTLPTDVHVDKWGNVYVAGGTNGDHRVQMFRSDGTFVRAIGSPALGDPAAVTTDRWGNVYVGEVGNGGRVTRFGPELLTSGSSWDGSGPSDIVAPRGIGVSLDGWVYVTDNSTQLITRWTRHGAFMDSRPAVGTGTWGLDVSQDGDVYTVTDISSGITESVAIYDWIWGRPTVTFGGNGTALGTFQRPYDVEADPLGRAYVIESQGNRGQVLSAAGTPLAVFGSGGAGVGQFQFPYGIAVSPDRKVFVADTFNHRVSRWNVSVPTEVANVEGDTRITTAIAASNKAYPHGAPGVVIATGYNWPDALGGAALAGKARGPILLTRPDTLPGEVRSELIRLGAEKVYILGSTSAVGSAVFNAVKAALPSAEVKRLGGDDRYETANRIAGEVRTLDPLHDGTAFVCTGAAYPDALSAAPIAAANGWPIYLTRPDRLPDSVRTAMLAHGTNHGYIIGGPAAVAPAVATALEDMSPLPPGAFMRIGGDNRYQTSARLADVAADGMGMLWSRPALAIGDNYPDALAGGPLQGSDASVLLLTPGRSLHPEAAAALSANKDRIYEVRFLGGSSVLTTTVRTAARARLH